MSPICVSESSAIQETERANSDSGQRNRLPRLRRIGPLRPKFAAISYLDASIAYDHNVFAILAYGAFLLWMIAGGGFQLVIGRDAWIASFRSGRDPGEREIRISGAIALVGLIHTPIWIGLLTGAFGSK